MVAVSSPRIAGRGTFFRGVHPPERKQLSEDASIEVLPVPKVVNVPLLQHLGAPCEVTVKQRSPVAMGETIGESGQFISAPVHASVSGVTQRESVATLPNGRHVATVPIKADEEQPLAGAALMEDVFGGDWPYEGAERQDPAAIADAAKRAGLVGLGGAAFPTFVKLLRNEKKPVETVLINGCECEPYLTADYRLMLEAPRPVIAGALLAKRAAGAAEVVVCVEDNKPLAAEALKKAAEGTGVGVAVLRTKYPQGGEKQLVFAVTGKEVPAGGLPLDVGIVVLNAGTSAALARAVYRNKPLTHRVVTVTGAGIAEPKNLLVPIGASYRDLIGHCGGLRSDTARVVAGGPMMGFTLGTLDTPVTKGTSGITALTHNDVRRADETACVRCGQCVDVCPMFLVPTKIAMASRARNTAIARQYHILSCVECGSCAYTCPASIPLVQLIRMGKTLLRKESQTK